MCIKRVPEGTLEAVKKVTYMPWLFWISPYALRAKNFMNKLTGTARPGFFLHFSSLCLNYSFYAFVILYILNSLSCAVFPLIYFLYFIIMKTEGREKLIKGGIIYENLSSH